jgi:hypothetical protein
LPDTANEAGNRRDLRSIGQREARQESAHDWMSIFGVRTLAEQVQRLAEPIRIACDRRGVG